MLWSRPSMTMPFRHRQHPVNILNGHSAAFSVCGQTLSSLKKISLQLRMTFYRFCGTVSIPAEYGKCSLVFWQLFLPTHPIISYLLIVLFIVDLMLSCTQIAFGNHTKVWQKCGQTFWLKTHPLLLCISHHAVTQLKQAYFWKDNAL